MVGLVNTIEYSRGMNPPETVSRVAWGARSRPLRYVVVGVWNTLFGYAAFFICLKALEVAGYGYLWALALSHFVAVTHNFVVHGRWVFAEGDRGGWAYVRYHQVYLGVLALHALLLSLLVEGVGISPEWAMLPSIVVATIASYLGHFRFSFRLPSESPASADSEAE